MLLDVVCNASNYLGSSVSPQHIFFKEDCLPEDLTLCVVYVGLTVSCAIILLLIALIVKRYTSPSFYWDPDGRVIHTVTSDEDLSSAIYARTTSVEFDD